MNAANKQQKEAVQRQLMRPLTKGGRTDRRLRTAGMAIANVILDSRIPLPTVKRNLEDLREAIDLAINICSVGGKKPVLH